MSQWRTNIHFLRTPQFPCLVSENWWGLATSIPSKWSLSRFKPLLCSLLLLRGGQPHEYSLCTALAERKPLQCLAFLSQNPLLLEKFKTYGNKSILKDNDHF